MTDGNMSVTARLILHAICSGYQLRVPHDGTAAALVQYSSGWHFNGRPVVHTVGPLSDNYVREVIASGRLWRLTAEDVENRLGWRRLGLDGENADFYCALQ